MTTYKFRAWLGNEKSPGSNEFMIYSHKHKSLSEFFQHYERRHGNAKKLMQWTGITDNTGNDIYEGDIIRVTPDDPDYKTIIHEVRWDKSGYWIDVFNCDFDITSLCFARDEYPYYQYDVIGNIYENPEMITNAPA